MIDIFKQCHTKRFIVFSSQDLEDIKNGKVVVVKDCNFSEGETPYDIYCVSEEWMKEYDSEEDLE